MLGVKCAGAQHPHGMIMGENQIFDRLVGPLAQFGKPVARGGGGRPRLEADQEIFAFDRADIGVAFGG